MHCQEDDFGLASHRFEAAQRFQPAQHRHGNIGDNHVGPELPSGVDQLVAIAYGAHKVEMIFQKGRQTLGDNRVVIGEHHSRTALHWFPPNGTCTRTSVLRCGRVSIAKLPPINRTRSSRLISPKPPERCASTRSNPCPSSAMTNSRLSPVDLRVTCAW